MTRFMISLEDAVGLVWHTFEDMKGGEIYVKKMPSMKVTDVATAVSNDATQQITGIRPGEKLHEQMIGHEDAPYTYEYSGYYKILPYIYNWYEDERRTNSGKSVGSDFIYSSDTNKDWMSIETLQKWLVESGVKM